MCAKATETPTRPGHLVLDHELLARLTPDSPRQDWERLLGRSGLLSIAPNQTPQGQQLAALKNGLLLWKEPTPTNTTPLQKDLAILAGAVVWFFIGSYFDLPNALNALIGILGAMACYSFLRTTESPPQTPAPKLYQLLRPFLSRTYIEVVGDTIIENTPHRSLISLRIEQLDLARIRVHDQQEETRSTLARIRELNQKLGRSIEDSETASLSSLMEGQEKQLEQIQQLQDRLQQALRGLDQLLEQRRLLAERLVLSQQAGSKVDFSPERGMAELEVEALEIEGLIHKMALSEVEEDQRLRALLEVSMIRTAG